MYFHALLCVLASLPMRTPARHAPRLYWTTSSTTSPAKTSLCAGASSATRRRCWTPWRPPRHTWRWTTLASRGYCRIRYTHAKHSLASTTMLFLLHMTLLVSITPILFAESWNRSKSPSRRTSTPTSRRCRPSRTSALATRYHHH